MGYWARVIEAVSTTRNLVITGYRRLVWEFAIYGKLGKDLVMESVSKIIIFMITGDGILGREFVMYGKPGKDSVTEEVSTISNFAITGSGIFNIWDIGQGRIQRTEPWTEYQARDNKCLSYQHLKILRRNSNGQNCGQDIRHRIISTSAIRN